MFSEFNTEQMEQYFHQVNRSLGKMPPQERAELHSELRQHLDGLIDAYQEMGLPPDEALRATLIRFGDPRKIGRRMYWEWQRG
jgi:hypothetical protein